MGAALPSDRDERMTPWWLGLSEAQAVVSCGEHQHRLSWHEGRFQALDHGDPDDERALAVLGGQPFACIELLDAWERHKDDLRALTLGPRAPSDLLRIDPDSLAPQPSRGSGRIPAQRPGVRGASAAANRATAIGGGWYSYAPGPPGRASGRISRQAAREAELIRLLALGGGIPDRLLATVAATWSRRSASSRTAATRKAAQELHAALHGRAFAALRSWLNEPKLAAGLTIISPADQPSFSRVEGRIEMRLPFNWLVDVWAKGLTTIFGRFCLAAETEDGQRWQLTTVAPDLDTVEQINLTLRPPR
jgi:hypothetical protein